MSERPPLRPPVGDGGRARPRVPLPSRAVPRLGGPVPPPPAGRGITPTGRSMPPTMGVAPPVRTGSAPPARAPLPARLPVSSSVGRAAPPGSELPGYVPPAPPGRSSGVAAPSTQRAAPGPSPGSAAQQRPTPGEGTAGVGRALYRADHRGISAAPGSSGHESIPSDKMSSLTIGSAHSREGNGDNGNGEDVSYGRGRGAARIGRELLRTRPDDLDVKTGQTGDQFNCVTNYFKLRKKPDWSLQQYRVDFSPEEDRTFVRKALLNRNREKLFGGKYIFDGTVLYTPATLNVYGDLVELTAQRDEDQQIMKITIRRVGELGPADHHYIQFFNIMLRKVMADLKLELVGRNYYDKQSAIALREWKLELWLGYTTSMRQHEKDVLLCCDIGTKVLRTDTVYDQLKSCERGHLKVAAEKLLLGAIVITRYNNKTYRVDDIDWNKHPSDSFSKKDGSQITFIQYFKDRYQCNITDPGQPMIISMPKKSELRSGMVDGPILLVPELCNMTGLSDEQRANFKLMKAVGEHTRQTPPQKMQTLMRFSQRVTGDREIGRELESWGLKLNPALESFKARTLPPEKILQAAGCPKLTYQVSNADWGNQLRNFKMFNGGAACQKWVVIFSPRDEKAAKDFATLVMRAGAGMGFQLRDPKTFTSRDNRTAAFAESINMAADLRPQMIMVVVPNNKGDSYHAIKKILCVDKPVPSQVITATLLSKGKSLMSVATKVALQMAAKLGAEPWGIELPMGDTMIVGYDSYHDSSQRGLAVGAVVSTMNQAMTRFSSTCTLHHNNEELLNQMKICMTTALRKFQSHNGKLPKRVIVYRDGVGDGQIGVVKDHEIAAMRLVFKENNMSPQFAFIIVSKRINTRFFQTSNGGAPINPPSGSVVDDVVTLPERYDFFLISQSVRQGTVNPTSYNIIENTTQFTPDHFQRLTYKLTHTYYNWPGTVRVPSVCQYAHKLAYLVGTSIHRMPNKALDELLFYL